MTPQEKRKATIIERYGSFSNMLAKRDVRDLILGGYNGGMARGIEKGFAKWDKQELVEYVGERERDSKGRFIPKAEETHTKSTKGKTNR